MKGLDHLLELLDAGYRVVWVCRERALHSVVVERLISPVVLIVLETGLVDCREVSRREEFEKLPQMIALGKYQEIVSICMKYAQQSDPVPAVGFVKQDKKSEANPVKAFCQFILGRLNETVADDKKSAADFYNKAIANGNAEATLYSVEVALKSIDENVRKDAVRMLKQLALTGNPSACIRYAAFILDEYKSSGKKSRLNFAFELLRKVEDEPSIDSFK